MISDLVSMEVHSVQKQLDTAQTLNVTLQSEKEQIQNKAAKQVH
jgi:hypothetical protein